MRILLTNDDSISASQLVPLARWCKKLGEVTIVVPKYEQSGKSHGIEMHKPFEAKQVQLADDVVAWSVDSTPADCVRFAILGLCGEFDLCISGINRGLNVGADMMYSGTVSAACEAVGHGVRALALSTSPEYYDSAVSQLDRVLEYFERNRLWEHNNIYNVNIPGAAPEIKITRQGGPYYSDDFEAMGNDMYHARGKSVWVDRNDNTLDTDATLHGYITVTPLTLDRTNKTVFEKLSLLNK